MRILAVVPLHYAKLTENMAFEIMHLNIEDQLFCRYNFVHNISPFYEATILFDI